MIKKFEVTSDIDINNRLSNVRIGGVYLGVLDVRKNQIKHTDKDGFPLTFYVGDTCKLL